MADERSENHVKPDGSVGAYNEQQILWTSSEGMGQNMHNILLREKPFEDLGSIVTSATGLNRPLVLISQDNGESDGATISHYEAESLRGVASSMDIPMTQNVVLSQGENRIADTVTSAVPSIRTIHVPLSERTEQPVLDLQRLSKLILYRQQARVLPKIILCRFINSK